MSGKLTLYDLKSYNVNLPLINLPPHTIMPTSTAHQYNSLRIIDER
jgi:hypothetical protein